jgi:hypothetical protein
MQALVKRANDYGLMSYKGKYFQKSSIQRTIKHPFYIGFILNKGILYKHHYGTIIDKQTFDMCQRLAGVFILGSNRTGFRKHIHT